MIRGTWTHAAVLYLVEDDKLLAMQSNGTQTLCGNLNSLSGPVDFESNLTQLVVTDGSYLYIYNPSSTQFIVGTGYPGGNRLSFLNQRINFDIRATQKFGWTALGDATVIDPLSFSSAESYPDKLVGHLAFNSELILCGEFSTEIWDPSGDDAVYVKSSAAIDYGCVAPFSLQKSANSAFWLARDSRGQAMVLSLLQHQAKRISTRAEEEKFQGLDLSNATAFTYSDGGQSFYCLNVPGLETTLVWDETYQQWAERGMWNGYWSQWQPTCHAFAYGKHYFGCGSVLAVLDPTVHTFLGQPNRRQRIAPVISKPTMKRTFFPSFEVLCEKGTGAQVQLRWSDDNGYNWSDTRTTSVGATGQYQRRARFNRLGSAYDRVFDLVCSDDAAFNPVSVNVPLS